jgi:hypothetical protein
MFKFSVNISWQTPQLIPTVSASSWIVRRQSTFINSQIASTFSVVLLVLGHPERLSPLSDALPGLKRECHQSLLSSLNNVLQKPHDYVRLVPCHHGMARPHVTDGGDTLQFWKVAVNILNKQLRRAHKGWFSSLGVGRGANNSSP